MDACNPQPWRFPPHSDDVRWVENPSIHGCKSSSFQIRLLQLCRRHLPLPAFMWMLFAWTRTPVILLRFACLILHDRVGPGTCQLSY